MKKLKALHLLLIFLISLSLTACMTRHRAPATVIPEAIEKKMESAGQILMVVDKSVLLWPAGKVYALEKQNGIWQQAFDPIKAVIGRNGFALPGEKREGDGRTPSGQYRLGTAFGYAPSINTKMPYRQALPDDLWVDDPEAPDYNHWVKVGQTQASSYEKMKRDDDQYKYGLVIEYNADPVIPGRGSAIFLHVWKKPGSPTAGCVAASEKDILKILGWLDPSTHPVIIINPETN